MDASHDHDYPAFPGGNHRHQHPLPLPAGDNEPVPASRNADRRFRLAAMRKHPPDCHADPMRIRCLLVDDNAAFLASARTLLGQQGVTIVGTASSSAEALRMATALRPDVVLVDIVLGDENGFDLARRLAESNGSSTAVIMTSTAAESDYADLVAESPAAGFLPKAELSAAGIRRILGR